MELLSVVNKGYENDSTPRRDTIRISTVNVLTVHYVKHYRLFNKRKGRKPEEETPVLSSRICEEAKLRKVMSILFVFRSSLTIDSSKHINLEFACLCVFHVRALSEQLEQLAI